MTRFARAKGSKASNEKVPEKATPWHDMKQDLIKSQNAAQMEKQRSKMNAVRQKNYDSFVKETESKITKKWAPFPSNQSKVIKKKPKRNKALTRFTEEDVTEEMIANMLQPDPEVDQKFNQMTEKIEKVLQKKNFNVKNNDEDAPKETSSKVIPKKIIVNKNKVKKTSVKIKPVVEDKTKISKNNILDVKKTKIQELKKNKQQINKETKSNVRNKATKGNSNKKIQQNTANKNLKNNQNIKVDNINKNNQGNNNEDAPEETSSKIAPEKITVNKNKVKKGALKIKPVVEDKTKISKNTLDVKKTKIQELKKNKQQKSKEIKNNIRNETEKGNSNKNIQQNTENKNLMNNQNIKVNNVNKNNQGNNKRAVKRKLPKERDDKEHERKKPFDPTKIIINGKEENIVLYNSFPVVESDYHRLVELQKSLINKGIPKNEVNKTMILERRKAEKFLSRQKKKICFQCREVGHLLFECPAIGDNNEQSLVETTATGICFKCGSTEHNYKECKLNQGFKFAKCFICREQGHIARECPDNPRGLYPKGGACNLCGDVTHLKKDCPKFAEEQKSNALFLNTISNSNIECLDGESNVEDNNKKSTKKIIKF